MIFSQKPPFGLGISQPKNGDMMIMLMGIWPGVKVTVQKDVEKP
jgi:hypothetical protein